MRKIFTFRFFDWLLARVIYVFPTWQFDKIWYSIFEIPLQSIFDATHWAMIFTDFVLHETKFFYKSNFQVLHGQIQISIYWWIIVAGRHQAWAVIFWPFFILACSSNQIPNLESTIPENFQLFESKLVFFDKKL